MFVKEEENVSQQSIDEIPANKPKDPEKILIVIEELVNLINPIENLENVPNILKAIEDHINLLKENKVTEISRQHSYIIKHLQDLILQFFELNLEWIPLFGRMINIQYYIQKNEIVEFDFIMFLKTRLMEMSNEEEIDMWVFTEILTFIDNALQDKPQVSCIFQDDYEAFLNFLSEQYVTGNCNTSLKNIILSIMSNMLDTYSMPLEFYVQMTNIFIETATVGNNNALSLIDSFMEKSADFIFIFCHEEVPLQPEPQPEPEPVPEPEEDGEEMKIKEVKVVTFEKKIKPTSLFNRMQLLINGHYTDNIITNMISIMTKLMKSQQEEASIVVAQYNPIPELYHRINNIHTFPMIPYIRMARKFIKYFPDNFNVFPELYTFIQDNFLEADFPTKYEFIKLLDMVLAYYENYPQDIQVIITYEMIKDIVEFVDSDIIPLAQTCVSILYRVTMAGLKLNPGERTLTRFGNGEGIFDYLNYHLIAVDVLGSCYFDEKMADLLETIDDEEFLKFAELFHQRTEELALRFSGIAVYNQHGQIEIDFLDNDNKYDYEDDDYNYNYHYS